jgi:hypothetical protein
MIKNGSEFYNNLFVHRQGYGICKINSLARYTDISTVSIDKSIYFTNIIDLLIILNKNNHIKL